MKVNVADLSTEVLLDSVRRNEIHVRRHLAANEPEKADHHNQQNAHFLAELSKRQNARRRR